MGHPKSKTTIDKLRRRRAAAVLLLMAEHDLTVDVVAVATGTKPGTVYKAVEGHFGHSAILEFLAARVGKPFTDLWQNYPRHPAA